LAAIFQRQPSAITSRLFKFKFASARQDFKKGSIEVKVMFEWEAVCQSETEEYVFPKPITEFMKQLYKKPVIYRWIVERTDTNDEMLMYIGEAARLCPDRLSGYLVPGPTQQTNIRLNQQFHECIAHGGKIRLETLKMTGAFVNDLDLTEKDLSRQDIRRLIERLLVTLYRSQGINLLNL
jgi:phosphoenolpyruvate synthase/pyruvate phosphate dikinase